MRAAARGDIPRTIPRLYGPFLPDGKSRPPGRHQRATAVASYEASVSTRVPGKGVVVESYAETDVWFKRSGQWKIVEIHYSENPSPPQK